MDFLQAASGKRAGHAWSLLRLGVSGLFLLAILDGTPLPTFGGPDIVTAILAGMHRDSWYECAAVATLGATIGAYLTFWMARRAGSEYLKRKFGNRRFSGMLKLFERWGLAALAVSTAIPFPFPTSLFFAAAGVSGCRTRTYLAVVAVCRAARYSLIAILADHYGRHFIRVVRHPLRYWGWMLLLVAIVSSLIYAVLTMNRRFEAAAADPPADSVPAL